MIPGKVKILHIIASPVIGGAEKVLLTLSKGLNSEKFSLVLGIFVDLRKNTNPFRDEAQKLGLHVEPIRLRMPYDFVQVLDLYRVIRKHHPHIIHTHGYKTNLLGLLMAKRFGIPIVATLHGRLQFVGTKKKPFQRLSLRALRYFDRIVTVSDELRFSLERRKVPPSKLITLRNVPSLISREDSSKSGSFRGEIGIPYNAKLIGFIGRLEPIKGCFQFIESASLLTRNNPDYWFVIVGEGSARKELERGVKKLGLDEKVIFCGFRDYLTDVFQSLDLYVLPSLNEGIPLTLLEAMTYGVPVVVTRVGGVPEVVNDRVNGIFVPPNNSRALAESIIESLTNKDETARRVLEAKKTINNDFSWEEWINKAECIYLEMMRRFHE